jgi:alcohol dehydrogenase
MAILSGEYTFLPLEKVIYGAGSRDQLAAEVDRLGCRRALVITGRTLMERTGVIRNIEALLGARHAGTYTGIRQHAPESGILEAVELARQYHADVLVSAGGGSPIDAAKAIAHRLAQSGGSYLPHIAIPTTLSAAEFSHVAGYTHEASKSKKGFSDPRATPRSVILDPQVTLPTPMWLWLSSGLRSLDHAIETLYSPGDHPVNDVLAIRAIQSLFECLPRSRAEPEDLESRQRCQIAAWMSYFGPGAVSAHKGLSHTIGKRIGASFDVPHGVTSCILLPHVIRYKAATGNEAARLAPAVRALGLVSVQAGEIDAALTLAEAVAGLVQNLELPARLRDVNVPQEAFEAIARAATEDPDLAPEILGILRQAW